jgi:colicin import membrane protein
MAYQIRHKKRSYPGFGRMLLVSVILHTGAIVGLVTAGVRSPIQPARPEPYVVALVAPSALTPSPGSRPAPDPPPLGQAQEPPPAPPVTKEPAPAVKKPSPPALKKKAAQPTKKPSPPAPKQQAKPPAKKPKAQKKPVAKSPKPQPSMSRQARETRQLAEAVDRVRQNMRTAERTARQPVGSRTVGGSGSGGGSGRRPPAFVGYTVLVQQRVKDSWIVTHQRAGLTAVVQFGIRPNGEIVDIELTRSSGNAAFDQSALRAVHHANPLPPPPVEHLHEFLSQKVQVAFGE